MKKLNYLIAMLLSVFAMCACSSDDNFDEDFKVGTVEMADEDCYVDLLNRKYSSSFSYYEKMSKEEGLSIKAFEKLEAPNDFYMVTIDNIENEFKEGRLVKLNEDYPMKDWSNYKMVIVSGNFRGCFDHITSTHVYKKDNTYHVELAYVVGQSFFCTFGKNYLTAFILPSKDCKIVFHPVYAGEYKFDEL